MSMFAVVGFLLRMGFLVQRADKLLQKKSFILEYAPKGAGGAVSSKGGFYTTVQKKNEAQVRRDRLVADTSMEPALARARVAVLAAIPLAALPWFLGASVKGRPMAAKPPTPEEAEKRKRIKVRDQELTQALNVILGGGDGRRELRRGSAFGGDEIE